METLPVELHSHILSFLDISDQLDLATVSRGWRAATELCLRQRRELVWRQPGFSSIRDYRERRALALLPRLPALRKLHIFTYYNDFDVDIVSENCRLLEDLDLTSFRLSVPALERLCGRCPRLVALQLPEECDADCLALLLRQLPGLRRLVLRYTALSAECVALLPAGLKRLQLECCELPELPAQPVGRWPVMHDLWMSLCRPGPDMTVLVACCPGLDGLKVDSSEATDGLLRTLSDLPRLRRLDLSSCDELTEAGLVRYLGRLKRLHTLNLTAVESVTDAVLGRLAALQTLTELALGVEENHESVQFSMAALQRLVLACPSLKSLYLDVWDKELMESLITGLARQLSEERNVTLILYDTALRKISPSILPSSRRPLRVTTYQAEDAEQ